MLPRGQSSIQVVVLLLQTFALSYFLISLSTCTINSSYLYMSLSVWHDCLNVVYEFFCIYMISFIHDAGSKHFFHLCADNFLCCVHVCLATYFSTVVQLTSGSSYQFLFIRSWCGALLFAYVHFSSALHVFFSFIVLLCLLVCACADYGVTCNLLMDCSCIYYEFGSFECA